MKQLLLIPLIALLFPFQVHAITSAFPDVQPDEWYAPFVEELVKDGVMSGHPDGNFKPSEPVYRAELAKTISELRWKLKQSRPFFEEHDIEILLTVITVLGWLITGLMIRKIVKQSTAGQAVQQQENTVIPSPVAPNQASDPKQITEEKNKKTNWWV